jgi:TetR/AcrR family transcriptional regulator
MRLNDGRARRADILGAAEREFAVAGLSGARVERIAAAANVNKQLLFHYFGSKEGLFLAALDGLLARFDPPVVEGTPMEQVRRWLAAVQRAAKAVPGFVGILADATANPDFPPAARQRLLVWRAAALNRLIGALEDGQRRGYFRDDMDPRGVAEAALGSALGVAALAASPDLGDVFADYSAWR